MLSLEDSQVGALIPFEKSFELSEEDAELLNLPPLNPYQIFVRTQSYIGEKNFKYVVEFLQADGRPVNPYKINGALLHVGDENIFRLSANQFALIKSVELGNKNPEDSPLLVVKKIQEQAKPAAAKLDGYLSEENKKIIVPEKLSVDFMEVADDKVKVQPVLLANVDGELNKIDSADFQGAFNNRKNIKQVYRGRHGMQYVFTETLREGLAQIKEVDTLSKADAARYSRQPGELFSGAAFDFNYSDRVTGTEEIPIDSYSDTGIFKTNWSEEEPAYHEPPAPKISKERSKIIALKIKENFEQIDYRKSGSARQTESELNYFFVDVLRPGKNLYTHQKFGVLRMYQLWIKGWHGILVADDMGLGKTLQTLTFIGGLKKFCTDYEEINQPILIVAPTALLTNWQAEYESLKENIFSEVLLLYGEALKKFYTKERTPNNRPKLSFRSLPPNSLALTTYETLRDYQFSFAEISWSLIIADEAQKIKNPNAGLTKALKAMKYDFAICLSGTPVENSWVDLWSIIDFVEPSHLEDLESFREKYISRLTSEAENIQRLGEELKGKLKPLLLRRMKEDNLQELPARKITPCREEMPPYQCEVYSAVLEKYRNGGFSTPLNFINELRRVSLHPDLDFMSDKKIFELAPHEFINRSARLIKTFALLDEIKTRGEKVLIFVTSLKMQMILRHLLEKIFGLKILPPINGKMVGAARQKFIDEFKKFEGFNVLILSPEAAGVGFTITEANNVIHLERTWNPAKENQATDRVYRIGQEKTVNVYLPLACNKNLRGKSFDENLDALLSFKKMLSANVLFPTIETDADIKTLAAILKPQDEILSPSHWTIEAVDSVTGFAFEKIICDLYNAMKNFSAEKTPNTNDFGADVVVQSRSDNTGLLIQCKHTENPDRGIGKEGVQEIYKAIAYYKEKYGGRKFQPVVVTNAKNFTSGAIEDAQEKGVKLITRRELENLLAVNKVLHSG